MEFNVGDKVVFIGGRVFPWHPHKGTVGEVLEANRTTCLVQWPKGSTTQNDLWYCKTMYLRAHTEEVSQNKTPLPV